MGAMFWPQKKLGDETDNNERDGTSSGSIVVGNKVSSYYSYISTGRTSICSYSDYITI